MPGERIYLDRTSLDLLTACERYITRDDWRRAAAAGQAPPCLVPLTGQILARRSGPGLPRTRWHRVTTQQVLAGEWPPALGSCSGEDCEHALAWLTERDMRLPVHGEASGLWTWPERNGGRPVRYHADENAPASATSAGSWGLIVLLVLGLAVTALATAVL